MSWKFAGIIFKKSYRSRYEDLLARLGVTGQLVGHAYPFAEAIQRKVGETAVGVVHGKTLLLDHLLPYDCSYEPGEEGPLDGVLAELSENGDVLNYIFDGVSGTYCFSLFRLGKRVRRWATEPGHVLCDEGEPLAAEQQAASKIEEVDKELPEIFAMTEDEARLFSVWEWFCGVSFQGLLQDETPLFDVYLP